MNRNDRRMLVFCASRALGGLELHLASLTQALARCGWDAAMLLRPGSPLAADARSRGLAVAELPAEAGRFAASLALRRELRRLRPALLLTGDGRDLPAAALALLAARQAPPLAHLQQMQFGRPKRDPYHRALYGRAAAWILPLEGMKRQALAMSHLAPSRISVIPYGIDRAPYLEAGTGREAARAALDLPADAFIVGTVGRLDRGKGQEHLVAALAEAPLRADPVHGPPMEGRPVHALLVGDDTRGERQQYSDFVRDLAARLGVGDRVHLRPFMADPAAAYRAMDAFALTSLAETYGLVTIEAMSSGLPIVATASGGTTELLEQHRTALLVPPADAAALAAALRELHDDAGLAERLGAAAREASQRYSLERECDAMETLFEEVIARGRQGRRGRPPASPPPSARD